jgi:hypothetical protein
MYLNDQLGDCVPAGLAHVKGVLVANQPASPPILTDAQIDTIYESCGYVPGNPSTDNGCEVLQTIDWWMANGIPSGTTPKPVGVLAVDPTNQNEVMLAIWLFGNLVIGIDLPDAWITPFPSASGFTWDVAGAPDPDNGHCPPGIDYTAQGMVISTWGMTGTMTWAAVSYYLAAAQGGEAYVVITQDSLNTATGLAPDGYDWAQMVAYFNSLGGNVTPPTPAPPPTPPTPPPTPVPPTPVPGSAPSHAAVDNAVTALGKGINQIQNQNIRSQVQRDYGAVKSSLAAYEAAVAAAFLSRPIAPTANPPTPAHPPQQPHPESEQPRTGQPEHPGGDQRGGRHE